MKKIGIILREYESKSENILSAFKSDLLTFLRKYNVDVLAIPIDFNNNEWDELERVEELINTCQGIILPGGAKEHALDFKIIKYLYEKDIPTLGICLGMQEMALTFNGDIEILKTHKHQSTDDYVHKIKIKMDSKLNKILGTNKTQVNSRHNEHVTTTDLSIAAVAPDLTIEAIEDKTKRFFIGVQWHPESLPNDTYSKKLFDAFIENLQ